MADLARWCSSTLPVLAKELDDDPFWSERLELFRGRGGGEHAIDLAVFQEPNLSYMLDGTKTVESRFAIRRFAPRRLASLRRVDPIRARTRTR